MIQSTGQTTTFQDVTDATDRPDVQFTGLVGQTFARMKPLCSLSVTSTAHSQDLDSHVD